ncbi:metallophosphoesterase family protein [Algicella marina]|uniref:Metallophosphoesterase-domain-containing protein n=1 Tax=Algicella marina TaxID=2683284 RepID=A0A6P1T2J8_9RHOB|nr:metallophosphoesterase [Algicella marina]QHQ35539.1 metallophosphoesterase-domain-containing protein [Algicella marina]
MGFRIAVVTDIHHGTGPEGIRGGTAMRSLEHFTKWANAQTPDLVLDLGDRIADIDRQTDLRLEAEVCAGLSQVCAPRVHINGNHDRDHLSVADNESVLGQSMGHETREAGDWRLLLWRAETVLVRGRGLTVNDEDIHWLREELSKDDRPVLLTSHVPPFKQDMTGNHFFQENAEIATYANIAAVSEVFEHCRCPLVTLSGHVHWTTAQQRGGIWHLTQQAMTETYQTGEPANAWGMIELGEDVLWQVHGADPISLRFRPAAARWAEPLARFADMPPLSRRA